MDTRPVCDKDGSLDNARLSKKFWVALARLCRLQCGESLTHYSRLDISRSRGFAARSAVSLRLTFGFPTIGCSRGYAAGSSHAASTIFTSFTRPTTLNKRPEGDL